LKNVLLFLFFAFPLIVPGQTRNYDYDEEIMNDLKFEYNQLLNSRYSLFPHKGTYLLPVAMNTMTHESLYSGMKSKEVKREKYYKSTEAEFQISFLIPILRSKDYTGWDFLFAYTHHSWWQVYNKDWSKQFRETNYMPELFARKLLLTKIPGSKYRIATLDFGYAHQSNGQIQMLSRSWDRIFARTSILHDDFLINLALWYRLPEKKGEDENPGIYETMGIGEIEFIKSIGSHTLSIKTPLTTQHFSSEIRYSYPWRDRLRWFFRFQGGYGHSLIEHDRPVQRFAVGIILEEFYDL
jgi:phospholipase A1/A2